MKYVNYAKQRTHNKRKTDAHSFEKAKRKRGSTISSVRSICSAAENDSFIAASQTAVLRQTLCATQLANELGRTTMGDMMHHHLSIWLICTVVALTYNADAQEPRKLSRPGISPGVWGVLELPHTPGPYPGIVILHGSRGWRTEYAQYARALADSGFVALAINHFAETGRDTVAGQPPRLWPIWQEVVRNAVDYLHELPSTRGQRFGLVGFSHGAFLAISMASSKPEIKAVVDYYGGINTTATSLEDQLRNFPPLLILHGDADTLVSVSFAQYLREAIVRRGGEVEMHIYPRAHHAFNSTFYQTYSDSAATDSFRLTIEFLRRRLMK